MLRRLTGILYVEILGLKKVLATNRYKRRSRFVMDPFPVCCGDVTVDCHQRRQAELWLGAFLGLASLGLVVMYEGLLACAETLVWALLVSS